MADDPPTGDESPGGQWGDGGEWPPGFVYRPEGEAAVRGAVAESGRAHFPPPAEPDSLAGRLSRLERSDLGNGDRLRARFGDDLLFVRDAGWYAWSDTHWDAEGGQDRAERKAHETARLIAAEAAHIEREGKFHGESDSDFAKRLKSWHGFAVGSGDVRRMKGMLDMARPYLTVTMREMDTGARLLNLANGTLVLEGACEELRPHSRADRISKVLPVAFDANAGCPKFDAFIARILPDAAVRDFVQRWFGYCLTGLTGEQVLVFFYGLGANGKTTLLNVVSDILGAYAVTLPFESFQHDDRKRGGDATPDLALLPGARLLRTTEPEARTRLSESMVKTLTGGETINARHLHKGFFEFRPEFKGTLAGNHKPEIRSQDEGIWRRVLLVHFGQSIPPAERVRDLDKVLVTEEAPGILNWMLDGLRVYLERGLLVPDAVVASTAEYRDESDPVGRFLAACVEPWPSGEVTAREIYEAYAAWCRANAETVWQQKTFGKALSDRDMDRAKLHGGITHYIGVRLVNVPQARARDSDGPDYDPDDPGP